MPNIYYVLGHGYRLLSELNPKMYQRPYTLQLAELRPLYYYNHALANLRRSPKFTESFAKTFEDVTYYISPESLPENERIPPTFEQRGVWESGYWHDHDRFLYAMELEKQYGLPSNKPAVGSWVLASRRDAGMSQEKLASMINISPDALNLIECGYMLPYVGIIHRLKRALEAPIAEPVDADV